MELGTIDPGQSFLELKQKFKNAFYFQSMQVAVIGLDADEVIRLIGDQVEIIKMGLVTQCPENFLTLVQSKLTEFENRSANFPYEHGGLFGCLGYEVMSLIEPKLKTSGYFQKLPKNEVLAEVFVSHNLIVFDLIQNKIHFALRDYKKSEIDFKKLVTLPLTQTNDMNVTEIFIPEVKEKFIQGVLKIKEHIRQGNIFQAVLSERFEIPVTTSALQLFAGVRQLCPSSYSFYFDFKESHFFGASPETLLKIKENLLETHPIAGTRSRGESLKQDADLENELRADEKEAAEHLMLVDLSRNDIGRVAQAGSVKVPAFRQIMRLPNVMHLISIVQGTKKTEKTNLQAFSACFPAGTLTGAPKIRAMEILSEIETRPRGYYGGAVVAFDFSGDLDSCIAIRLVEVKNAQAILRAGAGVVADSVPENEYQEILHKLKGLVSAISHVEKIYSNKLEFAYDSLNR